ncbi:hypothetical protein L2E82_27911 [Cichorium intybus]|uniref:Uncharacterized protein n=1 Tax=Cichorium intybus TaxID=13427 RepID=A0ACB9CUG8_CICIN|nr:hypothetical protein L2E82_27911 [Cichorium intybus]
MQIKSEKADPIEMGSDMICHRASSGIQFDDSSSCRRSSGVEAAAYSLGAEAAGSVEAEFRLTAESDCI